MTDIIDRLKLIEQAPIAPSYCSTAKDARAEIERLTALAQSNDDITWELTGENVRLNELFALKWDATQSAETEALRAENERLRAEAAYWKDMVPKQIRQNFPFEPKP